jgi:nucleoside-diphosphate-sugar epimerase
VVVTGAGGYIGGAVAAGLARRGRYVRGVVRSTRRAAELQACGAELVQLDLHELGRLADLAYGASVIVHCAFAATRSRELPAAIELDRDVTRTLLASRASVVYTSGIGVLAGGPAGRPVAEDYTPSPDAPLAWRYELERLVTDAGGRVVRPALVYGRAGNRILTDLTAQAAARGAAGYVGDGDGALPAVHLDDLADAYARVVAEGCDGGVYTVLGETTTSRVIAEAIGELLGVPAGPVTSPTMRAELPALEWIAGGELRATRLGCEKNFGGVPPDRRSPTTWLVGPMAFHADPGSRASRPHIANEYDGRDRFAARNRTQSVTAQLPFGARTA